MPLLESIGMSFTSLSTGGFVLNDNFYTNDLQLWILCALMLIGSISFIAHNKLMQRKFKAFLTSFEKNIFLLILLAAMGLAFYALHDIRLVIFEVISAFTTTGYSITPISMLPHLFIMVIMIGMVFGGNIASTAGGMKVFRIFALVKAIPWLLRKLSLPSRAIIPFKIRGKPFDEKSLLIMQIFVSCYIGFLVIGTFIFLLLGHSFLDSAFQVTSALGTVGLQTIELINVHWIGKLTLVLAMILGRLEIFPLLVLVRKIVRG